MNEERTPRGGVEILPIIGQVEGHYLASDGAKTCRYEQILPRLAEIECRGEAQGLLVLLNTVGGDLESGLAIGEAIASLSVPTVSLVLGGAHPIASVIAVSADFSFAAPTATLTLHPVRYSGTVLGAPQSWRYLSGMHKRVIAFLSSHSAAEEGALKELMLARDDMACDLGSVLGGEEAVRLGLIDAIVGLKEAAAELNRRIKARQS